MKLRTAGRLAVGSLALALVLGSLGCGKDGKTVEPKGKAPPGAKELTPKTPSGGGGTPGAPKGASQ